MYVCVHGRRGGCYEKWPWLRTWRWRRRRWRCRQQHFIGGDGMQWPFLATTITHATTDSSNDGYVSRGTHSGTSCRISALMIEWTCNLLICWFTLVHVNLCVNGDRSWWWWLIIMVRIIRLFVLHSDKQACSSPSTLVVGVGVVGDIIHSNSKPAAAAVGATGGRHGSWRRLGVRADVVSS